MSFQSDGDSCAGEAADTCSARDYDAEFNRSIPTLKQQHPLGCGYAALEIVARFHGRSLAALHDAAELARQHMSVWDLCELSRRIGFRPIAGTISPAGLGACPMPSVVLVGCKPEGNTQTLTHYLVLFQANDRQVVVSDPDDGRIKQYTRKHFDSRWMGIVVSFDNPGDTPSGIAGMHSLVTYS